jgi:DNA-binding response OmpR family regulator
MTTQEKVWQPSDPAAAIRIGDVLLRPGDPQILIRERPGFLLRQELALLELLAQHEGQVLSTLKLGQHLSRGCKPLSSQAVAVQIHRLRARLRPATVQIRTLRGFGYLLHTPPPQDS